MDVASGTFFTDEEDFWLDGPVPLSWERTWYSRSDYRGPLGNGGTTPRHGRRRGHGRGTLTLRMSDGIPVAFPCRQRRNPRSSSPSARRPVWNRTAATACGTWPRTSTTASRARSTIPCACLRAWPTATAWASASTTRKRACCAPSPTARAAAWGVEHDTRSGRILEICGPHPEDPEKEITLASYEYDADGNMTLQRNAAGDVMTYEYAGRLIVKETWRNGLAWYFEYDGTGVGSRCVHTWGDGGIYDHRLTFRVVTEVLDSHGELTVYHHRGGLVWKKVDANGGEHLWRYDDSRRLLAQTDPLGNSTRTDMTAGELHRQLRPCGGSVSAVSRQGGTCSNRPVSVTTPDGGTWGVRLWPLRQSGEPHQPEGAVTRMTYRNGAVASVKDPLRRGDEARHDRSITSRKPPTAGEHLAVRLRPAGQVRERHQPQGCGAEKGIRPCGPRGARARLRRQRHTPVLRRDRQPHRIPWQRPARGVRLLRHVEADKAPRPPGRGELPLWPGGTPAPCDKRELQSYEFTLDAVGNVTAEKGFDGAVRHYLRDRGRTRRRETLPSGNGKGIRLWRLLARDARLHTPRRRPRPDLRLRAVRAGWQASRGKHGGVRVQLPWDFRHGKRRRQHHTPHLRPYRQDTHARQHGGALLRYTRNAYGELGGSRPPAAATPTARLVGIGTPPRHAGLRGGAHPSGRHCPLVRLRWHRPSGGCPKHARTRARHMPLPLGRRRQAVVRGGQQAWRDTLLLCPRRGSSKGRNIPTAGGSGERATRWETCIPTRTWSCAATSVADGWSRTANGTASTTRTATWRNATRHGKVALTARRTAGDTGWNADGSLAKVGGPDKRGGGVHIRRARAQALKSFGTTGDAVGVERQRAAAPVEAAHREYSVMDDRWNTDTERRDMTVWLFDEDSFVPVAMIKEGRSYSILTDQLGTPTEAYDTEGNEVNGAGCSTWTGTSSGRRATRGNGTVPVPGGSIMTGRQGWRTTGSGTTTEDGNVYARSDWMGGIFPLGM